MPALDRDIIHTEDDIPELYLPNGRIGRPNLINTLPSPPPSENGSFDSRSKQSKTAAADRRQGGEQDLVRHTVDKASNGTARDEGGTSDGRYWLSDEASLSQVNDQLIALAEQRDDRDTLTSGFPASVAPDTRVTVGSALGPHHRAARKTLGEVESAITRPMERPPILPDLAPMPHPSLPNSSEHKTPINTSNSTPLTRSHRDQDARRPRNLTVDTAQRGTPASTIVSPQPRPATYRTLSTPANVRSPEPASSQDRRTASTHIRAGPKSEGLRIRNTPVVNESTVSPLLSSTPLPPLSLPTYLQLELSSHRPSQLYIHRPPSSEFPYESSQAKIERLLNFLLLPHQLESVLWFGTLACLDSWLYTFTILPLRLLKALYILTYSWCTNLVSEMAVMSSFVWRGTQRVWHRRRTRGDSAATEHVSAKSPESHQNTANHPPRGKLRGVRHHRRTQSIPSLLLPDDKADILKSLLIICTTLFLLRLDASRMYHWVRGQAAIKLYVIYNVLEVCDRLLSAIGQDVLECLFSREALERKANGRSKVLLPFSLFFLALAYTTVHATALFYQVVTLNVAVNSYNNALITLLISNQFVEIKSTVFKKFEKENLFQLTCADVVERFQLWHMLLIIAARNFVETGGLTWGSSALKSPPVQSTVLASANGSSSAGQIIPPWSVSSILPSSFTIVPTLLNSVSSYVPTISHVLGPFVIVLGSEMLIDWLKHAYIGKFNNNRPVIYGRFLDILAKDYYTNAFGDQNLTKRLGLPIIPLSCLMIRASVQTYQMFVAAWLPAPSPSSASLASIHEQYSASRGMQPQSTASAVARKVDELLYQIPSTLANSALTPHFTTALIALLIYLVLLACKVILGIMLLAFARSRYRAMKQRERNPSHYVDGGRRVGGWGVVEVDDDKRKWIYDDDPTAMRALEKRDAKDTAKRETEKEKGGNVEGLEKVQRYEMVAKRIW